MNTNDFKQFISFNFDELITEWETIVPQDVKEYFENFIGFAMAVWLEI
jgi:hypothetical protein